MPSFVRPLLWIVLAALSGLSCAHTLSACGACGPGRVCQRSELPGSSMPVYQCYTPCQSESQCGGAMRCNCEGPSCSHHSDSIPPNVCVAAQQRREDEFESRFVIDDHDQRFCDRCRTGEICVDVGRKEAPDFRCVKQCVRDSECPSPMLCNCGTEECAFHSATTAPNICVIPPPDWKSPANGAIRPTR